MAATIQSSSPQPPKPAVRSSAGNGSPNGDSYDALFSAYSKFGDTRGDGKSLTLSNSDKWMRSAGVIPSSIRAAKNKEPLTFTSTDTAIEFKKIAKTKKALSKKEYEEFLSALISRSMSLGSTPEDEEKRKKSLVDLKTKLVKGGPPTLSSSAASSSTSSSSGRPSTAASSSTGVEKVDSVVARLTDHTKYTGSHKLRFDDEGKGRGKAGRV